jgi:hypothetical protein
MRLKNKLERMWKEAAVAEIKVLSRHLPVETGTREKLQLGEPMSRPRFAWFTSRM